jgi:hypothetical protein
VLLLKFINASNHYLDLDRDVHSWYAFRVLPCSGTINRRAGGASTVIASYLARARGSNEPELSIARCKDLEQYIRECETFMMDLGHITGNEHDAKLHTLRDRFEELLGNANG